MVWIRLCCCRWVYTLISSAPNSIVKYLIVGSGPSGVAVANYLLVNGIRPTIVDGGVEASKVNLSNSQANRSDKTWFGSAMSYYQPPSSKLFYENNVDARASFARGGFSRVWGATFNFLNDYSDWPTEMIPTKEDIDSVRGLVPHSTTSWSLHSNVDGLEGSARSYDFFSRVLKRSARAGWIVKPSIIAIDNRLESNHRCNACKQCLVGCPNDSIWFAGDVLTEWDSLDLIDYRPGFIVKQIEEGDQVVVHMTDSDNNWHQIHAEKVFLATGATATAAIVVQSKLQKEVIIRDTSTALGVVFQMRSSLSLVDESHHTMSQWWIHSPRLLAQILPPTEDLISIMVERLKLPRFFHRILRVVIKRVHPIVAYLPMKNSGYIRVQLINEITNISGHSGGRSPRSSFKEELSQLSKLFLKSGYLMHRFMFQFKAPGGGYHHGSSFPQGSLSDHVGRPKFFRSVHIVDSSVLPSLPLGSITPTVMANAVRIARTVLSEEKS